MRGLKLSLSALLFLTACKTQRPTIELEERGVDDSTSQMSAEQTTNASAFLKVADLSLPVDSKPYSRIRVEVIPQNVDAKSPIKTIVDNNYNRTVKIPIVAGLKYELVVKAYQGGTEIYSNIYCNNSKYFTAKSGANNYTVPVCPVPALDNAKPVSSDEVEMIETPSMPGSN